MQALQGADIPKEPGLAREDPSEGQRGAPIVSTGFVDSFLKKTYFIHSHYLLYFPIFFTPPVSSLSPLLPHSSNVATIF